MIDGMASLFVDVHPSKAKLTLFSLGNCFLIASAIKAYSFYQMLLRADADSTATSPRNVLYDCCSSRFDIVLRAICAERNPKMR
jgi:hypothetical protein